MVNLIYFCYFCVIDLITILLLRLLDIIHVCDLDFCIIYFCHVYIVLSEWLLMDSHVRIFCMFSNSSCLAVNGN